MAGAVSVFKNWSNSVLFSGFSHWQIGAFDGALSNSNSCLHHSPRSEYDMDGCFMNLLNCFGFLFLRHGPQLPVAVCQRPCQHTYVKQLHGPFAFCCYMDYNSWFVSWLHSLSVMNTRILVDFHFRQCQHCQAERPTVVKLQKMAAEKFTKPRIYWSPAFAIFAVIRPRSRPKID